MRPLELRREPNNPYDANAIAVHYGDLQLGFFNKRLAAHIAPLIDAGARYRARVASSTGGPSINSGRPSIAASTSSSSAIALAALLAPLRDDGGLRDRRRRRGRGRRARAPRVNRGLAAARRAARRARTGGRRTKHARGARHGARQVVLLSVCSGAARLRRREAKRSSSIRCARWPTISTRLCAARSIRLDCAAFARTVRSTTKNAKISSRALREGAWDVVLATPEFLEFHRDALRGDSTPSFVVVDEAHHLAESRHRPAYARLAATIASAWRAADAGPDGDGRRGRLSAHRRGSAHRCLGNRSDGARESRGRRRARHER